MFLTSRLLEFFREEIIIAILLSFLICSLPWGYSNFLVRSQDGYLFLFVLFLMILLFVYGIKFIRCKQNSIVITKVDLLIFAYIILVLLLSLTQATKLSTETIIEYAGLILIYVVIRNLNKEVFPILFMSMMLGGIVQALYGNMQLYGIYQSHHNLFKMTGSFFNPGPYAGYLVSVLPIAIIMYIFFNHSERNGMHNANKVLTINSLPLLWTSLSRYVPLVTIVVIVLVLPASKSRAAWLAAAVSSGYILFQMWTSGFSIVIHQDKWFNMLKTRSSKQQGTIWIRFLNSPLKKIVSILIIIVVLAGGLWGLYQMKKGSADGRLLIWKVTTQMIKDRPLWGHGFNQFTANYMDYQAEYFKGNPDNPEAMVAGDNNYAFNEFLKITSELGLLGLLVVLALLYFVLFGKHGSNLTDFDKTLLLTSRAGLLAIIIFGSFSYPGEILPIKLNFILFIAIISSLQKPIIMQGRALNLKFLYIPKWVYRVIAIITLGLIPLAAFHINKLYGAHKTWKTAYTLYQMGAYSACIDDYRKAFPTLRYNGDFLVNYGKALSMAEKHTEAIDMLEYAKNYLPNTILYTALGDSYKSVGNIKEAEQAYLQAWYMIPSRFYPKYLLAKLYEETGQKEKAVEVAKELLNKEVKVHSTAIKEIWGEMEKILTTNDN